MQVNPANPRRSLVSRPSQSEKSSPSSLEYPADDVAPARNSRPVVLLHGTLVDKDGIEKYREFALKNGHPVNFRTYPTITKGDRIEASAEVASKQVNLSRAEVGRQNLARYSELSPEALRREFAISGELYGQRDPNAEVFFAAVPGLLERVGQLLDQDTPILEKSLSGQLKRLETELAQSFEASGMDPSTAQGGARELLDTVCPKAVLVGHSAGGYTAFAMAVNPETVPDDDPFTFDGGNGVGEVVVLSAPIKKGLDRPAPPGIAGLPFYQYDSKVLRPLENSPPGRFLLANPFVGAAYIAAKGIAQATSYLNFMALAQLSSPATHLLRPGNAQVEEGSEFFQNYVENKTIPEGTSIISVTSPHDKLVLEERARLETEQTNGHTFSIDLEVSEADLKRERPTWAHVIMTEKPDSFKRQFAEHLKSDPAALHKILDRANDDGVRHEALSMIGSQLKASELGSHPEIRSALEKVAAERMPFEDSPSFLAHRLLLGLN